MTHATYTTRRTRIASPNLTHAFISAAGGPVRCGIAVIRADKWTQEFASRVKPRLRCVLPDQTGGSRKVLPGSGRYDQMDATQHVTQYVEGVWNSGGRLYHDLRRSRVEG